MDPLSEKKLSILKAMKSLAEAGGETMDLVAANIPLIIECAGSDYEQLAIESATLLKLMAAIPKHKNSLIAKGALATVEHALLYGPDEASAALKAALKALKDTPAPAKPSGSSLAASAPGAYHGPPGGCAATSSIAAPSKKEVRGVQINMDGLLGVKSNEDKYIRSLLMVDGVTSVTIDRKREVALVYTYEDSMKTKLYAVVQQTCDQIQDAAGKQRMVIRGDHAAYLEEEEEEDGSSMFFGSAGGKNATLAKRSTGSGLAGRQEKTAEERAKERSAASTSAAPARGGLFSWLWG